VDAAGRIETIRELCSFEGRIAGSDAERRAANRVAERLREVGRRATVEPIHVHPQLGLIYAAHCLLGVAGSLVAVAVPVVGFALVLFAATSLYLDLNARLYLLRRLFFRRASQNVVSKGSRPTAPARLLITAHLDVARTGAVHRPKNVRRLGWIAARLPTLSPLRVLFWSLAVLVPIVGARAAGLDSQLISVLQLPPTLVLLVAIFAFVDIELSDVVPGANDNASGVATALSLAAELEVEAPENLDVWVVLSGGEECMMEGMRSFLRSRRKLFDRASTYVVNLDSVGSGEVRFEVGEGPAVTYALDSRLTQLAAAIAAADAEQENRFRASPLRHGFATDALPARLRGYAATTITCLEPGSSLPANFHTPADTPERIDPEALERAHAFAFELIRRLDADVGRSSGDERSAAMELEHA
jgi:acetylornithine deacetylase/succinyl-diaminopimelate desuccinylase-like protein